MHAFVFWMLLDSLVSFAVFRDLLERFFVPILLSIAASIGISNFSLRFFKWFHRTLHSPDR